MIVNSRLTSDAAAGTVHLGRPWHPGGDTTAVNSNRPQLSATAAADHTAQKYLAGADGWNPGGHRLTD